MKKFPTLRLIILSILMSNVNSNAILSQASINLENFFTCATVNPVTNIPEDLSGVCYNDDTGTLFVVMDEGEMHELDLSGNHIREISLSGIDDSEGIAYMGNSKFAIADEASNEIVLVTIQAAPINTATNAGTIDPGIAFASDGIEGIAYNAANDELFVVKEISYMEIRKITNASTANPTVTTPFDLEAKAMTYGGFTDAAGLSFTSFGTLLILSQEGNLAVEVNPATGNMIGTSSLSTNMNQPEGIITVSDQFIVVVGEDSEFKTFLRTGITCPPITVLPTITAHPQNVSICSGMATTFSVTASNGNLYQWEQDSGAGFTQISNITPYSGATTTTLSIADVTGLDGYVYRCVVTNAMGSVTSSSATLDVMVCQSPPANDDCADAIIVTCGDVVQGTTNLATHETHDDCFMSTTSLQGVWYKLIGTGVSTTLSTCSSNTSFDTEIRVFEGTCSNLDCIAYNDDYSSCIISSLHSTVAFMADIGKEYHIWVSPFDTNAQSGDFELTITCAPCIDPDLDGICNSFDLCPNDSDVAIDFTGGNNVADGDYIEISHHQDLNLVDGDFSIEAWIYSTGTGHRTIISKGHGFAATATPYVFAIWDEAIAPGAGRLGLYLSGDWQFGNSVILQCEWMHVAVTFDYNTKTATFYLNGLADGQAMYNSSNTTFSNTDSNPMFISRQGYANNRHNFTGRLDELAVWNKALSIADITASMAAPYSGSEAGLIAYYDFNDADACIANTANTILVDKANNHDGTLMNFALTTGCSSNWAPGHNQGACQPLDCANSLDLTGTQTTDEDYESFSYIYSDQTIDSAAEVEYDATTKVRLLQNFKVEPGAIFRAVIDGCN